MSLPSPLLLILHLRPHLRPHRRPHLHPHRRPHRPPHLRPTFVFTIFLCPIALTQPDLVLIFFSGTKRRETRSIGSFFKLIPILIPISNFGSKFCTTFTHTFPILAPSVCSPAFAGSNGVVFWGPPVVVCAISGVQLRAGLCGECR